jgi:ABC-type transport system involved in multi-copper enzyme maturation permease subunit
VQRPIDLADLPATTAPSPPVGDNALFWKEVLHGAGPAMPKLLHEPVLPAVVAIIAVVTLWGGAAIYWSTPNRPAIDLREVNLGGFNPLVRIGGIILLTAVCLVAGFRAAGSVVRERDRRTLDGLLVLPVTRDHILRAKWLGSVLRMRYLLYWLAALWLGGTCIGAVHPLALPLLTLTAAAHIAFLASLGVCVSVTARNALRANFTMAVLLLLFFCGGWLMWLGIGTPSCSKDSAASFLAAGLNPWYSWWALAVPLIAPARGEAVNNLNLLAVSDWGLVFALLAALFWWLAVRRFRRDQGRAA